SPTSFRSPQGSSPQTRSSRHSSRSAAGASKGSRFQRTGCFGSPGSPINPTLLPTTDDGPLIGLLVLSRRGRSAAGRRLRTESRNLERSTQPRTGRRDMSMDMNKMMQQVQQLQAQMAQAQEELKNETVEASAGGGMVTVKATGGLEIVEIKIAPDAIDPDDPDLLADMVLAAVNEALRSAQSLVESKLGSAMGGLQGLGLP